MKLSSETIGPVRVVTVFEEALDGGNAQDFRREMAGHVVRMQRVLDLPLEPRGGVRRADRVAGPVGAGVGVKRR